MFNFFVTAKVGAWDQPGYEYARGRFLEYTSDDIAAKFQKLEERQIKTLMELPCLFAYEGTDEPMRVGRLKSIKSRAGGHLLYIDPEFDPQIPPIPYERIEPLSRLLRSRVPHCF